MEHNERFGYLFVLGKGVKTIKSKDIKVVFLTRKFSQQDDLHCCASMQVLKGGNCHRVIWKTPPYSGTEIG